MELVADHRCIVWCKQLQVLLAKCLVSSVSNSTGKMKNSQAVIRIFEEEIKYGFSTPKLTKTAIKCQDEVDSYDTVFRIESGYTCLSQKVLGTDNDVIIISRSLNTTIISCPNRNRTNCSLIPPQLIQVIPIAKQNCKVFSAIP